MEPSIGLFENSREANLSSTIAMVEDVLIELGHFLNECRVESPNALRSWSVIKGSASIRINLIDGDRYVHLRVISPVMTMTDDVDRPALYRHLLELNNGALRSVAFAISGECVLLVSERSTHDLDRSEVLDILARLQDYADAYDNALVDEFGGRLGGSVA